LHIEASVVVKAPREKVYAAYTDFESMPKWSGLAGVKVVKREGDTVYLESGGSPGRARKMVLSPPAAVRSESEKRFTRSSRVVSFEESSEGTRVTATLDVRVKGAWARLLSTREGDEFEPAIREELESFARYVEGLGETPPGDQREKKGPEG
jgi:uncharacterized membrane protein